MKYKDIPKGSIFAIEGTKSYPKLRTKKGHLDLRDEIFGSELNNSEREVEGMSIADIADTFDMSLADANDWIKEMIEKYKEYV